MTPSPDNRAASDDRAASGSEPRSLDDVVFDEGGLIPGIIQDEVTGRVLMVGWLNSESLALTRETGRVHFWSRSRRHLWMKGEESGNVLDVTDITADCDLDTLLIRVRPAGPTCHTGAVSCFDDPALVGAGSGPPGAELPGPQGFTWLEELWAVIEGRVEDPPPGSYTASLIAGGVDTVGRKVTEEATEVLLAAKDHAAAGDRLDGAAERVAEEAADLVYHLLVLLAERRITPAAVIDELRSRSH